MMEVVLIDDDPVSNMIHSRLIQSTLADHVVQVFTDPMQAMEYLKAPAFSGLTLLDINMPDMNAWDCLDYMEEHNILSDVIILSSSIDPKDRERASEYPNVKNFFNKPLSKENIRGLVAGAED